VDGVEDSVGDEVNKATVAHRAELAGAGAPGEGGAAGATSLAPHGERGRIDWLQPGPFSHLTFCFTSDTPQCASFCFCDIAHAVRTR
jgi:hypothetical protein